MQQKKIFRNSNYLLDCKECELKIMEIHHYILHFECKIK